MEDVQPEYMALTFDMAGPTFRHQRYEAYKATRVFEYYTSQSYLEMIENRFGPETIAQIKQITSYRLERDLLTATLEPRPAMAATTMLL